MSAAVAQPAVQERLFAPPKELLLLDQTKGQWIQVCLADEIKPTLGWMRQQLLRALKLTAEPTALRLWAYTEVDRAFLGSDKETRELSYYTFDGWLAFEVLQAPVPLVIKPAVGKAASLHVQLNDTVATLKRIIAAEFGVPANEQRLIISDKQLDGDERTLANCGVKADSMVHLTVRGRGGFKLPEAEAKFVDVSNPAGLQTSAFVSSAPVWRVCDPGLNLEGKCTNLCCAAYNQMVILKMGTNLMFDVVLEATSATTACPCCQRFVKPSTCAFVGCKWKWAGVKAATDGHPAKELQSKFAEAPVDRYTRFNPASTAEGGSGMASWLSLRFQVLAWCGRAKCPPSCGVCHKKIPGSPQQVKPPPDDDDVPQLLYKDKLWTMVASDGETTEAVSESDSDDGSSGST